MWRMMELFGVVVVLFSSLAMAAAPAKASKSAAEPYPNRLSVDAFAGDINGAGLDLTFSGTSPWLLGVNVGGGYDVYAKEGGGGANVLIGHDKVTYDVGGSTAHFYLSLGGGYYGDGLFRSGVGALFFFNQKSDHPFAFKFDVGYRYHATEEHGVAGTVALSWLPAFFQF